MGADLLLAFVRCPHDSDGKEIPPSPQLAKAMQERAIEAIASIDENLPTHQLLEYFADNGDEHWHSIAVEFVCGFIFDAFSGEGTWGNYLPRDCTFARLDDKDWIVSGGMSWGDTPSESYDEIDLLSHLGINDEPYNPASWERNL